jgi:hypothetical protein
VRLVCSTEQVVDAVQDAMREDRSIFTTSVAAGSEDQRYSQAHLDTLHVNIRKLLKETS